MIYYIYNSLPDNFRMQCTIYLRKLQYFVRYMASIPSAELNQTGLLIAYSYLVTQMVYNEGRMGSGFR
jgi:hypothetical protein